MSKHKTKSSVLKVGQIWRRKKTGTLVQIVRLKDHSWGAGDPYYDVSWETVDQPRVRRGSCYQEYWLRDNELVTPPGEVASS